MATLVFTALGTAIGGPLGGALGSLVGSSIDHAIVGGSKREGPRLKELGVSTSSYGSAIAMHHGTIRAPGTIVWATDLAEHSATSGGGKGAPGTTTYSYSVSFAVALSSRPIEGIGRIWADGNLLRGASGDLKAGGAFRLYTGHGDQEPDPLLASDRPDTPAFRGTAYCVFEDLDLTDFGNRIPALTFEIIADGGEVLIDNLLATLPGRTALSRPLAGLQGFSNEGGALADMLSVVGELYPIACDAGGDELSLLAGDSLPGDAPILPPAAAAFDDGESFAAQTGRVGHRKADDQAVPDGVRYYDVARDYQPGMQRADGRARPGRNRTIEFPGALAAGDARTLANGAAARAAWSRDTINWRMADLDPALVPGMIVRVPDRTGLWSIETWEWRDQGIELELRRLPRAQATPQAADAGSFLPAADNALTPTELAVYEVPWDGRGNADVRRVFAAMSSSSRGWPGAALYRVEEGELIPLDASSRRRCITGQLASALPPSPAVLLERSAWFDVDLASTDLALDPCDGAALARGANRALVGAEVLQFARAERLSDQRWRISGLLRGRGGTEPAASAGHQAGAAFVLLHAAPLLLAPDQLGSAGEETFAALGLADSEPVLAQLANPGMTLRPLSPVHPRMEAGADGAIALSWCRRARGAWSWLDGIDVPIVEQAEAYTVGLGDPDSPSLAWQRATPRLDLSAAEWSQLTFAHPGAQLWVRQAGTFALSDPLLLTTLP